MNSMILCSVFMLSPKSPEMKTLSCLIIMLFWGQIIQICAAQS